MATKKPVRKVGEIRLIPYDTGKAIGTINGMEDPYILFYHKKIWSGKGWRKVKVG